MKKTFVFLFFAGIFSLTFGQDCKFFYPAVENAQLEYKSFDKKNKLSGTSVQRIKEIKRGPESLAATIEAESFDAKGTSQGKAELTARCEKGVFYVDMKNYMNQQSMESYKDMEMSMEGGTLEIPSKLNVGDVLKPGEMKMSFSANGMTLMNMSIGISNRKVEAIENVVTDAGTFSCYKISYDATTKMGGFTVASKGVEYYNNDIGMVKSEAYDKKGELQSTTILSTLKK
jgi:hypothetical protein